MQLELHGSGSPTKQGQHHQRDEVQFSPGTLWALVGFPGILGRLIGPGFQMPMKQFRASTKGMSFEPIWLEMLHTP